MPIDQMVGTLRRRRYGKVSINIGVSSSLDRGARGQTQAAALVESHPVVRPILTYVKI
jgi:hypothetical protein